MKGNEFRDGWKEDERVKRIHSCGNYLLDPTISLDSSLAYLTEQPEEVK